jgi:hypothetical protein
MTSLGASGDLIALVQDSTALPIMLFSLVAKAIADNFDRRQLMLAAQLFLLAVSVALTVCTSWTHDALAPAGLLPPADLASVGQLEMLVDP